MRLHIHYTQKTVLWRLFCALVVLKKICFVFNNIDANLVTDVQHIGAVSPLGQHNGLLLLPFQTVTLRSFSRDWRREIILGTNRKKWQFSPISDTRNTKYNGHQQSHHKNNIQKIISINNNTGKCFKIENGLVKKNLISLYRTQVLAVIKTQKSKSKGTSLLTVHSTMCGQIPSSEHKPTQPAQPPEYNVCVCVCMCVRSNES